MKRFVKFCLENYKGKQCLNFKAKTKVRKSQYCYRTSLYKCEVQSVIIICGVWSAGQQAVGVPAQRKGYPPDHCWGERQEAGRQTGQQLDCPHTFSQTPGFEINSYLQKQWHLSSVLSFDPYDIVQQCLQGHEVGRATRLIAFRCIESVVLKHEAGLHFWLQVDLGLYDHD